MNCIRSSAAAACSLRGVSAGRENGQPGEFLRAGGGESTTRFVGRSVEAGAVGVGAQASAGGASAGGASAAVAVGGAAAATAAAGGAVTEAEGWKRDRNSLT